MLKESNKTKTNKKPAQLVVWRFTVLALILQYLATFFTKCHLEAEECACH